MRCAVVDIGSNTTRLLVADVVGALPREILAHKVHTHLGRALRACEAPGSAESEALLGRGGDATLTLAAGAASSGDGLPTPAAVAGLVVAGVTEQVAAAREAGAQRLRVVATAAIRDAVVGAELCAAIRAATGVPVDVLSGADEARLAFLGATTTAPPPGPKGGFGSFQRPRPASRSVTEDARGTLVAVVDVGGGSTELAVGTAAAGVEWSVSVPIGSGWLADRHLRGDPPTAGELQDVRDEVDGALAGLEPPAVERALAVGGSAASLTRIAGNRLDAARVGAAIATLTAAPAATIADRTGLLEARVRLLPAGLLLLAAVAARLARPLELGCGGLREGVCLELAAL